jgi:hypothetical protein
MYIKFLGIISVGFNVTAQPLINHLFFRYRRKKLEYGKTIYQLFVDCKKACDSVRMEVMHNILIEFGVPMKTSCDD